MLISEPLQAGGGDVVFERRAGWVGPWPSERAFFSRLPIGHGIRVFVGELVSEGPLISSDHSSYGARDVRELDVE